MSFGAIRKSLDGHIDNADIRLLKKLFGQTKTRAEGVLVDRFRADNYSQLPRITRLERGFMERNQRSGSHIQIYRITLLALTMLNTVRSNKYLRAMQKVVKFMRQQYRLNLSKPVLVLDVIKAFPEFAADDILEALDYVTQTHYVTGAGQDFPRGEQAMLCPQEGILGLRSVEQALEVYVGYAQTTQTIAGAGFATYNQYDDEEKLSLMQIANAELTDNWMSNLPQKFHPLFTEIEAGLKSEQLILPCFGLRGLVEMACYDKLGVPKKFKEAVQALIANGSLTHVQGRQVSALYRYGSSVVHSGLTPESADVKNAMIVIVGMLRHLYHTQAAADHLSESLATAKIPAVQKGDNTFLYFAYGSNMFLDRLKARVSSTKLVGVATLSGYKLAWHKRSTDGSAKCDIQKSHDTADCVWGIVAEINIEQKQTLDDFEGLGHGYDEADFAIEMNGKRIRALAYYATATDSTLQPYGWYQELVLAGAVEHGLPATYIALIRSVTVKSDGDEYNHTKEFRPVLTRAREVIAAQRARKTLDGQESA